MNPENTGYIPVDELTKQLNVHPNTTRRRIRVAGVPTFSDPHDRRKILVLAEDAERLMQPLPTTWGNGERGVATMVD